MSESIAVLDVGKTHAKLAAVGRDGSVLEGPSHANAMRSRDGRRILDVEGIETWLTEGLRALGSRTAITAIVPVAHGAAAAYVGSSGLASPVLDYEAEAPPEILSAYRALRDPFGETLSPTLPAGLNLGLQLYWQEQASPGLRAPGTRIVPWPQYWAWHLCGVLASEVTSLGCHTDLWRPRARDFSALAMTRGWHGRFAPLRKAADVLGRLRPALAERTGLSPACEILCGLHDSNAALLAARGVAQVAGGEFALVSTGTWFVCFASGGASSPPLDPERDTLANVDVEGRPVPSARFMGGREYEAIVGPDFSGTATLDDARALIARGVATRPSFVSGSGPFPHGEGATVGEVRTPAERAALASLHLALMTKTSLDLIRAHGPIVVEGRFASDPVYAAALASLCGPAPVLVSMRADGVAFGAARLRWPSLSGECRAVRASLDLRAYAAAWAAGAG